MYLKKLTLINFKNYNELELSFSSKINCFIGRNGNHICSIPDIEKKVIAAKLYIREHREEAFWSLL